VFPHRPGPFLNDELTARFAEHGRKRRAYLDRLIAAAGNDLSMVWQEAPSRLPNGTDSEREFAIAGRAVPAARDEAEADRTAPVMV
jgi:hypothetical protein